MLFRIREYLLLLLLCVASSSVAFHFHLRQKFAPRHHATILFDRSSCDAFSVGQHVVVTDDVMHRGESLKSRKGVVTETWTKCDTDPTCCCAEMVDPGYAVRVKFGEGSSVGGSFSHFFAESELDVVKDTDDMGYTLRENRSPYDVHVYYKTEEERSHALKMRTKMQSEFPWMRFYKPKDGPLGPHPVPMWEADFAEYDNRHRWEDVRSFVEKERGPCSVLIHPYSYDGDYADHTRHAYWAGQKLRLRIG